MPDDNTKISYTSLVKQVLLKALTGTGIEDFEVYNGKNLDKSGFGKNSIEKIKKTNKCDCYLVWRTKFTDDADVRDAVKMISNSMKSRFGLSIKTIKGKIKDGDKDVYAVIIPLTMVVTFVDESK